MLVSNLNCVSLLLAAAVSTSAQTLPVIDLVKSVHRAQLNTTGGYYSFKNIPYAEPPVGPLRFRNPLPLVSINRTVNDGLAPRSCYQQGGPWFEFSIPLVFQRLAEGGISPPPPPEGPPPGPPPGQAEDCLVLDVLVPKTVYDAKAAGTLTKSLPVVVWIHGGGYIEGSKDQINPAGLIAESRRNGASGFIYVAINYRMGLFGFPPRKPTMLDVGSNAGLYDQRLALEWVKANIHRFGGNPQAVTVIGESAGAGAIVTQLTAFGGIDHTSPFQKAIIQSPYIPPAEDAAAYSILYDKFLAAGSLSSYAEARTRTSAEIQAINVAMIGAAAFSSTVFAPNVDGIFIPSPPAQLLSLGLVDRSVKVIVAHNLDEGLLFTDPRISQTDNSEFISYLSGFMPSLPASKITHLATVVYPPDFSGAQPYTTQIGRTKLAVAEAFMDCVAFGVHGAYRNQSRGYQFSYFPGMHAQDLEYTFFNGQEANGLGVPVLPAVAAVMQRWFVDFIVGGTGNSYTQIPVYTAQANMVNITGTGYPVVRDPAANKRCRYWLEGLS